MVDRRLPFERCARASEARRVEVLEPAKRRHWSILAAALLTVAGCAGVASPPVGAPIGDRLVDETFSKYSYEVFSGKTAAIAIGLAAVNGGPGLCVAMGHDGLRDDPAESAEIDAWLRSLSVRADNRVLIPNLAFAPIHLSDALIGRSARCVEVEDAPPTLQFEIAAPNP